MGFSTQASGGQDVVGSDGVVLDRSDEILAPLLDVAAFAVHPIQMWLQVAVGTGHVSDFDAEKDVAIVIGPAQATLGGLIMRQAARFLLARGFGQIESVDFDVFIFFLALVDRIAYEGQLAAIRRSNHVLNAQWELGDEARAGSQVRRFLLF